MTQEKTLTGYPSIDKLWLKYYSKEAINTPLPECTIVFITLKPEYKGKVEMVLMGLEQLLLQKLPERDTVEAYQIIEELPLTPIGKVDYRALEQLG